jgi:hypothetical protein
MGATDKTEKLKLPVYESLTTGTNQLKKSQRIKNTYIYQHLRQRTISQSKKA